MTINDKGYPVKHFPMNTKRYCQTLNLKDNPELIRTYREIHSEEKMWPEILAGIRQVGILEMEIYLLGTRLFMIVEVPEDFDWDKQMAILARLPRQEEWEAFTSRFQQALSTYSSAEKWQLMERIFHLYDK